MATNPWLEGIQTCARFRSGPRTLPQLLEPALHHEQHEPANQGGACLMSLVELQYDRQRPISCVQAWAQDAFQCKQPTSRQDALDLRAWLHNQLSDLNASAAQEKEARLKYAEDALQLYNTSYHELTRQVLHLIDLPSY
jgi:hypothetical protein